jgi:hypothetical protein
VGKTNRNQIQIYFTARIRFSSKTVLLPLGQKGKFIYIQMQGFELLNCTSTSWEKSAGKKRMKISLYRYKCQKKKKSLGPV